MYFDNVLYFDNVFQQCPFIQAKLTGTASRIVKSLHLSNNEIEPSDFTKKMMPIIWISHSALIWFPDNISFIHTLLRMNKWYTHTHTNIHSQNEDVEMGKREDQVEPHQKWRHQEGGAHKTCRFVDCLRREHNHILVKSLRLEVSGRRSRGRPKKRWRDNIKRWRDNIQGDMKKYQLTEDMAQDRKYWMTKIVAGPTQGDGQERWEGEKV